MSYIKKWNDAVSDLAGRITTDIQIEIQESIAWETDGYEFCEHLEGDDYIQFANEVRDEILKQLQDILQLIIARNLTTKATNSI